MAEQLEQRYCIKFCQKLGDSQSETVRKIKQAFEDEAMSKTQIKTWFNRFKSGRTSVKSDPRSGRPQTARNATVIEKVKSLIKNNPCLTIRKLAEAAGTSRTITHTIIRNDLKMKSSISPASKKKQSLKTPKIARNEKKTKNERVKNSKNVKQNSSDAKCLPQRPSEEQIVNKPSTFPQNVGWAQIPDNSIQYPNNSLGSSDMAPYYY